MMTSLSKGKISDKILMKIWLVLREVASSQTALQTPGIAISALAEVTALWNLFSMQPPFIAYIVRHHHRASLNHAL